MALETSDTSGADGKKPMRSSPSSPRWAFRATSPARSAWRITARASGRKSRPACVSATRRLVRSNNAVPSSSSSSLTCWLSGGWEMLRRSAARRKCSSSATAMKYFRWRRSIRQTYQIECNKYYTISISDSNIHRRPGTSRIRPGPRSAERCMTDHSLTNFDPISLEIYWSRLISIADEAATSLVRTAFSTIVRESNDYGTVIMDRNGDSLSENTGGIASFSCILPRTTQAFLAKFPAETWRPGDAVITNDPWLATGHLPDFTVVSPIFHD